MHIYLFCGLPVGLKSERYTRYGSSVETTLQKQLVNILATV